MHNAAYKNQGKQEAMVGNATAANVLEGKTFTNSSTVGATGTMPNNGAVTGTITTSGGSYTIPAGYHNGSGKVTGPTLAALVKNSNVTLNNASNLLSGVTAYGKDGVKYTGSMINNGSWKSTPTTKGQVKIPKGYHDGNGYIDTTQLYNNAVDNTISLITTELYKGELKTEIIFNETIKGTNTLTQNNIIIPFIKKDNSNKYMLFSVTIDTSLTSWTNSYDDSSSALMEFSSYEYNSKDSTKNSTALMENSHNIKNGTYNSPAQTYTDVISLIGNITNANSDSISLDILIKTSEKLGNMSYSMVNAKAIVKITANYIKI